LLAVKGASAGDELDRDRAVLEGLGFQPPEVLHFVAAGERAGTASQLTTTVIAVTWGDVSRET
jgi:hypothetical protein